LIRSTQKHRIIPIDLSLKPIRSDEGIVMWLLAEGTQLEAEGTEMTQRQPAQATSSENQIYA